MFPLALALCFASGYLLVSLMWPRGKASVCATLVKLTIAAGFGLAFFSVEFVVERLLEVNHLVSFDAGCLALLFVFYLLGRRRPVRDIAELPDTGDLHIRGWVRGALTTAFATGVLAAIYSAVLRVIVHPHGEGWDAFSIWNLRARFLFLGGSNWRDGFTTVISWSHPDYPLLLPASVAHFWSYLGHDDPIVPAIVGVVFAFGTLALLVLSIAQLRGRNAALLAGLALTSTPFFIEQGTSQYADVPLSFFILASIVLLHVGRNYAGTLLLAGMAAGFAAWTKNEGLLFLFALAIGMVRTVLLRNDRDASTDFSNQKWGRFIPFLAGAAPVLLMIALFKHYIGTGGDLFSSPEIMIHKLLTPSRYWVTLRWFAKETFRFGEWWFVPCTVTMVVFYLIVRRKPTPVQDLLQRGCVLALGLTLMGYFVIYLITPRDLYWHLRFSLNRLFLQLWPVTIFLFFLFVARQSSAISQHEPKPDQNAHSC